jgi:secondary thiamine-phosphate synthase enzyme
VGVEARQTTPAARYHGWRRAAKACGIWEHDKVDDNGAAHLKAAILGPSESVPIQAGRLLLGTWQGIALVECDGPREREIVIDIR